MGTSKKELESLTIMELRTFAREQSVSLRRNWKKDDIVAALLRSVNPKRGRKPKPARKPAPPAVQPKAKPATGKALLQAKAAPPPVPAPRPDFPAMPAPVKAAEATLAAPTRFSAPSKAATPAQRPSRRSPEASSFNASDKTSGKHSAKSRTTDGRRPVERSEGAITNQEIRPNPVDGAHVTLMVRNANILFAYWQAPATSLKTRDARLMLRIHDLSSSVGGMAGRDYYDIPVFSTQSSLYVLLRMPGHRFFCELGLLYRDGHFVALARSGETEAPPDRARPSTKKAAAFHRRVYGLAPGKALKVDQLSFVFSGSDE